MKITNVRAVQPIASNSPPDWRTSLGQILVAVDTDCGLTGYGVGGGGLAGVHVVRTVLRDLLLKQDPDCIGELWQQMYAATLPFGRKGLAIMAISGVDLALWDLRGKAAGASVARLLGGSPTKAVPTYATVWDDRLETVLAEGHTAIKLHVEHRESADRIADVAARVARARLLIGPDRQLMIDAWMRWDVETTLAVADRVQEYNLGWIEEPLPADDLAGYARLCQQSSIPIAGGEHEFTAAGFRELIDGRLHQVLQPDVCWCGGLSELIRIYEMAHAAGLRVCPHRGSELWALHAIVALDPQPLAESGRPWMTWVGGQPPIINGRIQLPAAAGLGVQIDEDNLPVRAEQ
jgi:L-rhamnonate dehydratase